MSSKFIYGVLSETNEVLELRNLERSFARPLSRREQAVIPCSSAWTCRHVLRRSASRRPPFRIPFAFFLSGVMFFMAGCNGSKVSTVGEVEFKVVADSVFHVPAPGGETPVEVALQITNRRKTPLRFKRMDTLFITLTDPNGRKLPMDGGRDGTVPGEAISPPVAPGQSLLIDRAGRLTWTGGATLRLIGKDGFGGIWHIDGLKRGIYQLQIEYENIQEGGSSGGTVWTGKAVTPPKEVELK